MDLMAGRHDFFGVNLGANFSLIDLPTIKNSKGLITICENILPFEVKRIYWIYSSDNQLRGGHRHKLTSQCLVALSGYVSIEMCDGVHNEVIALDDPNKALIVEPKDWHTMKFGSGAVLLVMASHFYDVNDYIDQPYER